MSYFLDTLKKVPEKHDILNLLAGIDDMWHKIGLSLKVASNILRGLQSQKITNIIKLDQVLQSCIATTSSPVTWDTVITAINGPIVNMDRELRTYKILHERLIK